MKKVKKGVPENVQKGIPLKVRPGHTVRLEITDEPLTVHTGLSLLYAMAEALEIPRILDEHIHVKERERGYPNRSMSWLSRPMRLSAAISSMIWKPSGKM